MHNKIKQLLVQYSQEKDSGLYKALDEVSKEYEGIYNELLEENRKVDEYDIELRAIIAELNATNEKLAEKNTQLEEFDMEIRAMNEELRAANEELQQKNIQLEEYRKRLEATMRAGNLAWWEMNIKTGAVKFNEQKTRMLGYNSPGFKHYSDFTKLVHPDDYEPMMEAMIKCMKATLVYSADYRIKASNGEYKWFHDIGVVTATDDNGKPLMVTGVVIDITERKNSEEQLKQRIKYEENLAHFSNTLLLSSENAINRALEYILDASATARVYIFENFTDENGALCMKQTHEICAEGVKPENNNPTLQHIDYEKEGFARWKKELANNNLISGNIDHFPKEEQEILALQNIQSILVIPIWVNKKWFGFIGFDNIYRKRDWNQNDIRLLKTISEIIGIYIENRQKEKAIINQNEELQKLNATKDKFFSIISHDLKNPFTTLLGMSESLMNNYEQYPDEKRKEQIQAIGDSSKKTFKLLETLLVWSRTQTGRIKFNPQEIALEDLINENLQFHTNTAKAKNISLEKEGTSGVFVKGDYVMLNTVIRNLVSNAIKFTPGGGKIIIGNKNENKDEVLCYVKDSGIGITPENKKKLFRVDQGFSSKGTNQEKGTGLGLIISKEFIEKHGGEIGVESKPNEGTTFYFTLKKIKKQEIGVDDCFSDPAILIRDINNNEETKQDFINRVVPVFKETKGKYSAKGIKKFTYLLKGFGEKHNISTLNDFAVMIEKHLESFDIPKINACFTEFEKTLEAVETPNPRSG